jgi:hypothetical protein
VSDEYHGDFRQQEHDHQYWEHSIAMLAVRLGSYTHSTTDTDMKISQMLDSKYIKRGDLDEFDGERVVTIVKIGRGNIARDDEEPDMKWMIRFKEFSKPMVLNTTNIQLIAQATGSDDTDDWIGKEVILYDDPNVSFGGKLVGGLRVKRVPKSKAAPAKPVGSMADMPSDDLDDDSSIPF